MRHPTSNRDDAGGRPAGSAKYLYFQVGGKGAGGLFRPLGVGASPTLAAIYGRQADISWLHLSRKQGRLLPRWERYPRLPPFDLTLNERNPMKPVIRYQ